MAHGENISQNVPSWVEPTLQVFEGSCCEKRKHFCEGEIGGMGTEKYKATPGYATLNKETQKVPGNQATYFRCLPQQTSGFQVQGFT